MFECHAKLNKSEIYHVIRKQYYREHYYVLSKSKINYAAVVHMLRIEDNGRQSI